eukprot:GHVN01070488.1.p1 GENE.GHVN01070488.1~~GHVN01070488.1.p1  ORF type:complete len:318 (+),score=58.48 GHVN01070488.1:276-1229(+)
MWDSASLSEWNTSLATYPNVVNAYESSTQAKSGLAELEHFVWDQLGRSVRGRETQYLEADEYRQVIRWKLKRGKWRPRLQQFADNLEADVIKEQSLKAFKALKHNSLPAAICHLSKLKGCGPATASAILAACDDSVPFMSDELLITVPCFQGQRDYTIDVYTTLVHELRKKVKELGVLGGVWSVKDVERAVFASVNSKKLKLNAETALSKGDEVTAVSTPTPPKSEEIKGKKILNKPFSEEKIEVEENTEDANKNPGASVKDKDNNLIITIDEVGRLTGQEETTSQRGTKRKVATVQRGEVLKSRRKSERVEIVRDD